MKCWYAEPQSPVCSPKEVILLALIIECGAYDDKSRKPQKFVLWFEISMINFH